MAHRSWGSPLPTAFAVALLAGSVQLGIGYGLGLLRLPPGLDALAPDQWAAQLTWVAWTALVATVAGALVGERRLYPDGGAAPNPRSARADPVGTGSVDTPPVEPDDGTGTATGPSVRTNRTVASRLVLCATAALGALFVTPFSAFPARAVTVGPVDPVVAVGLTVGVAVSGGLVIAFAALVSGPVRRNVTLVTGALWALAVGVVAPALGRPTDPLPQVRLGMPGTGAPDLPLLLLMPALALLTGLLVGLLARRQGRRSLLSGAAGAAGPAMVAVSTVVAGACAGQPATPYWSTLLAVGTGTLGSALATAWRWPFVTGPVRIRRARAIPDPQRTAIEPTDILLPLPRRPTGSDAPDSGYDGNVTEVESIGKPSPEPAADPMAAPTPEPDAPPAPGSAGTPASAQTGVPESAATGTPASAQTGTPESAPGKQSVRNGESRRRLFRRSRAGRGPDAPGGRGTDAPLPPQDEEYVDWVSQLGRPVPDSSDPRSNQASGR